ncbi:MAG: hypothetical protein PHQ42_03665, partial [Patescibacteria group bacterium]|nr:hypothetical protein [Patescibacteria group bacterium]
ATAFHAPHKLLKGLTFFRIFYKINPADTDKHSAARFKPHPAHAHARAKASGSKDSDCQFGLAMPIR